MIMATTAVNMDTKKSRGRGREGSERGRHGGKSTKIRRGSRMEKKNPCRNYGRGSRQMRNVDDTAGL